MADSKLSALSAGAAIADADLFYSDQSATSVKQAATAFSKYASGRSTFYNVQDYGWLPDGTDRSTQALALLALASAAGAGTLVFPAATAAYRADSQLFIPNDNATIPTQANFRFTGAGGGQMWGDVSRTQKGAAILDLRYTAVDGNAKIESRGSGSLVIDNLTILDGGTANATPFIHSTNTTLTIRQNTFIGSGSATQDVIVLGGTGDTTPGKIVTSPFQGYGTAIDSNQFRKTNRGVYARTFANSIVITNNSWLGAIGTIAMEFDGQTSDIFNPYVTGNLIEMNDPKIYGIVLNGSVLHGYFNNAFYDKEITYVADYRLIGTSTNNIFISSLTAGTMFSSSTSGSQFALNTYLGAQAAQNNPFADGVAASLFANGAEVDGRWNAANHAAGILNIRNSAHTDLLLSLGVDDATDTGKIDAWSSGGLNRELILQPRGGPATVYAALARRPSAVTAANGLNSNIVLYAADATAKSSYVRLSGPTGAFSIGGFSNKASGVATYPGSELTIYNSTSQQMTLKNEDASSTAANRIKTLTGADVVLRAGTSSATFIYDDTDLRWVLIATN